MLRLAHRFDGDGVGLGDLPVDLLHRGRQFVGRRRDVAHVGGGLARGGRGLRGAVGGELDDVGHHLGAVAHLLRQSQQLAERRFHIAGEARDLGGDLLLALGARLRVAGDGLVQLLVAPHGDLEHRDRTRERADLVAAAAVRHVDVGLAFRHGFGRARHRGERAHEGARDQHGAEDCEHQRERGQHAHQHGGIADAFLDQRIDALGALRVGLRQQLDVGGQPGMVGISALARSQGIELGAAPRDLAPRFLEMLDALADSAEPRGLLRRQVPQQLGHGRRQPVVVADQVVRRLLGAVGIERRGDRARIERGGIAAVR